MAANNSNPPVVPFMCKAAGACGAGLVNTPTTPSLSRVGPIPVRTGCAMPLAAYGM